MTHLAGPAPDPGHEDPQADARVPDIPPVARPEHHRDGARRAVRTRELHLPAGRRIHTSRQQARPYDGHGRHTASDPSSPPRPNDARRDPSRSGGQPDHRPPGTTGSRHHERTRPNTQPGCSGNQAVNTAPRPAPPIRRSTTTGAWAVTTTATRAGGSAATSQSAPTTSTPSSGTTSRTCSPTPR